MAQTTLKAFASQIGISPERLLQQLVAAGILGKGADDSLSDDEKMTEILLAAPAAADLVGKTDQEVKLTTEPILDNLLGQALTPAIMASNYDAKESEQPSSG